MDKTNKNLSDNKTSDQSVIYVPVVTVLGHVDHGKTSLLDAIRKTNIAAREHGGITQKIGASQIEVKNAGKSRKITFIDTPGHEAFMQMRGRGAKVADIGLLVVSSVDGVMPQTQESIRILKASGIPYIVVLTKSDVAEKSIEKVKGQLLKNEVLLEGKGGDVPVIEVSAKTGQNIKELLDLILLVSDMHPVEVENEFKGVVIESKLDPKAGPKATVVIKGGKLGVRDEIFADKIKAKVRSLINDKGAQVKEAGVGDAVEILGFEKVPNVGSIVQSALRSSRQFENSSNASTPAGSSQSSVALGARPVAGSSEEFSHAETSRAEALLSVILVADSFGSLEAIIEAVKDKVSILLQKTGEVEPSDILFAKSVGAVALSFNVKPDKNIEKMAQDEKVLLRNYNLIYEMLDEIDDFLEGKRLSLEPKILGKAKILASFPFDKKKILGISVTEGRIAKGDRVQINRNDSLVGEGTVVSLRKGKEQASKAETGEEAGILLSNEFDFRVGDVVISQS